MKNRQNTILISAFVGLLCFLISFPLSALSADTASVQSIQNHIEIIDARLNALKNQYDHNHAGNLLATTFSNHGLTWATRYAAPWGGWYSNQFFDAKDSYYMSHRQHLLDSKNYAKNTTISAAQLDTLQQGMEAWKTNETKLAALFNHALSVHVKKARALEDLHNKRQEYLKIPSQNIAARQRVYQQIQQLEHQKKVYDSVLKIDRETIRKRASSVFFSALGSKKPIETSDSTAKQWQLTTPSHPEDNNNTDPVSDRPLGQPSTHGDDHQAAILGNVLRVESGQTQRGTLENKQTALLETIEQAINRCDTTAYRSSSERFSNLIDDAQQHRDQARDLENQIRERVQSLRQISPERLKRLGLLGPLEEQTDELSKAHQETARWEAVVRTLMQDRDTYQRDYWDYCTEPNSR